VYVDTENNSFGAWVGFGCVYHVTHEFGPDALRAELLEDSDGGDGDDFFRPRLPALGLDGAADGTGQFPVHVRKLRKRPRRLHVLVIGVAVVDAPEEDAVDFPDVRQAPESRSSRDPAERLRRRRHDLARSQNPEVRHLGNVAGIVPGNVTENWHGKYHGECHGKI